jgi:hypothetical protein
MAAKEAGEGLQVQHRTGQGSGDAHHGLHVGDDELAEPVDIRGIGPESRPCVRSRKRLAARWRRDSRKGNYRDMEPLVGGGGFEPP